MANDNRSNPRPRSQSERRPLLFDRLLWFCTATGFIAAAAVLFLFGWSLWSAVAIAILIACPTVIAVALNVQRGFRSSNSKNKRGKHAQI